MKIGDRVMVVNEVSGVFSKIGVIVQHPYARLFSKVKGRVFVKFDERILSMGKFEVAKVWSN